MAISVKFVTILNLHMKITLPISALAAILGFALASVPVTVHAATTAPAAPAAAPTKAKPTPYSGKLTAIDTTGNTITVTGKEVLVLGLTPKTTYKKDHKVATLADFVVGDNVTGSYTKDATGKLLAHSLHKATAKAPKTAKPAATPAPAAPTAQ